MTLYYRVAVALSAALLVSRGTISGTTNVPAAGSSVSTAHALPVVGANDNRKPAGVLRNDTLRINLVVQMARWYPEAADGPYVDVAAVGEEGQTPTIPGPLIRVPAGTTIVATVRNDLPDSAAWVRGMATRPEAGDSTEIKPGESHTFSFAAGDPGTYMYSVEPGKTDWDNHERETMTSALIVDAPNARTDDRVFVINIYGEPIDSTRYRNALAINGKGWPYTERITANVGDSLRWRIINGTVRNHPMHLHGFYFRTMSQGNINKDAAFTPDKQRMSVTEDMNAFSSISLVFSPDRPGNWLFHCHLVFHVNHDARLDDTGGEHMHEADPNKHMAGLVLGIVVNQGAKKIAAIVGDTAKLKLFADEKQRTGFTPRAMGYVLQRGTTAPAGDSVEKAGGVIVLHRNVPTQVTIYNRSHEGTSVHWHGLELESFSDGVAGWSGMTSRVAPMVAPQDSFVAHLTMPRAGTFIYHTHLNDVEQLTSGMYGAVLVLEKDEKYDPSTDHTFVAGWDGDSGKHFLVNGDSTSPPPMEIDHGKTQRLRFVNIAPADRYVFAVRQDTSVVTWTPLAKDGYYYPSGYRKDGPASRRLGVGETFDAEFTPMMPGEYRITVRRPNLPDFWVQRVIVR